MDNPFTEIYKTTEASARIALDQLHRGEVNAICWNATEEHKARDQKMQPDRKVIYMDGPHPFVEAKPPVIAPRSDEMIVRQPDIGLSPDTMPGKRAPLADPGPAVARTPVP